MASQRTSLAPVPQQALDILEALMGWDTPRTGSTPVEVYTPGHRPSSTTTPAPLAA